MEVFDCVQQRKCVASQLDLSVVGYLMKDRLVRILSQVRCTCCPVIGRANICCRTQERDGEPIRSEHLLVSLVCIPGLLRTVTRSPTDGWVHLIGTAAFSEHSRWWSATDMHGWPSGAASRDLQQAPATIRCSERGDSEHSGIVQVRSVLKDGRGKQR